MPIVFLRYNRDVTRCGRTVRISAAIYLTDAQFI